MLDVQFFVTCIVAGFVAQLIAGSLGMGYGTSLSLFLLSLGIPPAVASASIHASEVFTSGASGFSHLRIGNVDKALFKKLTVAGVAGGVAGALVLTWIPGHVLKPFIAVYLLIMGLFIIYKAVRKPDMQNVTTHLIPLGLIGGFLDALGGGGWGPVVTSTLLARGNNPRSTVGSVMLSGFFLSLSVAIILFLHVPILDQLQIIVALIIGGMIATPISIYVHRRLPHRALLALVGALIMVLSIHSILVVLGA